mgnify:FL=1
MNPQGGTEILHNNLLKYVNSNWQDHINLLISRCDPSLISHDKTNIVWQHVMI